MTGLPKNAHVSQHPCLKAKLSQLRSASTASKEVQTLVHEIALMVGYEALAAGLTVKEDGTVSWPVVCALAARVPCDSMSPMIAGHIMAV
jgi:uracil phosphoribosyltransferase